MYHFTAATINLRGRTQRWLSRRHLLVGQIVDFLPDIVALQEIDMSIGQGSWLTRQVNIRISGSGKAPYRIIQARRSTMRHFYKAVGIMTRLPIIYSDSLPLGLDGQVAIRANMELPAGAAGTRRQSLDFICVQLHHGAVSDVRVVQLMNLVGWINEKRRVPLQVIAGDFNEKPDDTAVTFLRQSYRSAYAEVHKHDPIATYPTNLVQPQPVTASCLDYVFLSPAVYRVTSASIFCDQAAFNDETLYPSSHVGLLIGLEV